MKKAELIKYLGCKSDENRFLYEVLNGFEPMIRELQSHALPLGYSTIDLRYFINLSSPSRARTYNNSVNSRVLYH